MKRIPCAAILLCLLLLFFGCEQSPPTEQETRDAPPLSTTEPVQQESEEETGIPKPPQLQLAIIRDATVAYQNLKVYGFALNRDDGFLLGDSLHPLDDPTPLYAEAKAGERVTFFCRTPIKELVLHFWHVGADLDDCRVDYPGEEGIDLEADGVYMLLVTFSDDSYAEYAFRTAAEA